MRVTHQCDPSNVARPHLCPYINFASAIAIGTAQTLNSRAFAEWQTTTTDAESVLPATEHEIFPKNAKTAKNAMADVHQETAFFGAVVDAEREADE